MVSMYHFQCCLKDGNEILKRNIIHFRCFKQSLLFINPLCWFVCLRAANLLTVGHVSKQQFHDTGRHN